MRIAETRLHVTRVPLKRDLKTTQSSLGDARVVVIVELVADDRTRGFGEATADPGFSSETPETVEAILKATLLPAIVGVDIHDIALAHARMDEAIPGNTCAKAAIDEALHDVLGKRLGVPVYRLLGGAFRERLQTSFDVGLDDPAAMAEEARSAVLRGSDTIKIKVRGDLSVDREVVTLIAKAVGRDARLWLDANEAYSGHEAVRLVRSLNGIDIVCFEQPVPRWDVAGLRYVRKSLDVPVVADESVFSVHDAITLIRAEAVDLFVIKLMKCGGIHPARAIASTAHAANIRCVLIQSIETGIGTAAAVHLALTLQNAAAVHGLDNRQFIADDPASGLIYGARSVAAPDAAGLGVTWQMPPGEAIR